MSFPILALPVELQLMVLNRIECAHDRFNLAMELDSYYQCNEYVEYICDNERDVFAPWLLTTSLVWIRCNCEECTAEQKRDYARMMCYEEDYDYHFE